MFLLSTFAIFAIAHFTPSHFGGAEWGWVIHNKGVSDALVLMSQEFSQNSTTHQKQSNQGRHKGVLYPHGFAIRMDWQSVFVYIHRRGVSALLVSIDRGNAKAYKQWNEQQTTPRILC